eukprot:XP_012809001.1 PREDICTED: mucin-19-like [Xenopus tropicalis]
MDPVDPNKTTSSPLGNSQQVNTAMNVFQDAIARALGISNPDGAPVGANAGTVTGPSSSANVAGNSSAGPSTRSSGRKRACSPEDQTSSRKHRRTDSEGKGSTSNLKNMAPATSKEQRRSTRAQSAAKRLKWKYKKIKRRTWNKPKVSRVQEAQAIKVFQDAIAEALESSLATGTSGAGTQVASSPGPSTSMASSSGATPSTCSSGRKRAHSPEDQTKCRKRHRTDSATSKEQRGSTRAQSASNRLKRKYKKIKRRTLHKPRVSRVQEAQAIKVLQDAIAEALESSLATGTSGAGTQVASSPVPSTSMASSSGATPSTSSSGRKRAHSPEDQTRSWKHRRTDSEGKGSTSNLKNMAPAISEEQRGSSRAQSASKRLKRKYKKSKRRSLHKPRVSRELEAQAIKVFQDAIAKALEISSATGTSGAGTQVASSPVPSTSMASSSGATPSTSSSGRKRAHSSEEQPRINTKDNETDTNSTNTSRQTCKKSTKGIKNRQPSPYSQQQASDFQLFQDAVAKALGISDSETNTSVATNQTFIPPAKSVAKDTSTVPSTSSLVRNNDGVQLQNSSTGNIAGIPSPATETRIDPTISSSVAQKDNSGQQNQCNVQNNVTSPENPSTTTRGIFEYIELSERERAIQAHQQQMALQQQMEHLRESPYEDSPLFRNPIPETRKRKLDTNPEDVALWNPKRLRPRLGKGPKVRPKALATKAETRDVQGKEDSTSDDIFPPTSVIMTRLRARAQAMKRKDPSRSEQSDKKDDSQSK